MTTTDERAVSACCCCRKEFPSNKTTEFFAEEGAGMRCTVLCENCRDQFEQDTNYVLTGDKLQPDEFDRLQTWLNIESDDEPAHKTGVRSLVVEFCDGTKEEVHITDGVAHIHLGGQSYSTASVRDYVKSLTGKILGTPRNQTAKLATLAPPELRVAQALLHEGFAATYEHPGYIDIANSAKGRSYHYAFGTANDYWAGHGVTKDNEACEPFFDSTFPSSSVDAEVLGDVVEWIKKSIKG